MNDESALYFECHVTIEPPSNEFGQRAPLISVLEAISRDHGFRVSTFEMFTKNEAPKVFTSARDKSYASISTRMCRFIRALNTAKFKVLRYKIEDTLIDSNKQGDFLAIF